MTPVKPVEAELLVVTGMSGAGRSTAADASEDHGWDVVENLPPQRVGTLAEIVSHAPGSISKLAVVMDVCSKALFADIRAALRNLEASGVGFRVLFLDADDGVLVRRFEQARRPHPRRAAAGSSTASPPNASCCTNCAPPPTSRAWTHHRR